MFRWQVGFSFPFNGINQTIPKMGGERELMCVGLYVHKQVRYGTVMDEKGSVVNQARFTTILRA